MSKPITIMVPIKAKAECRDEVRRRLIELARLTRQEPGNINYILHEGPSDPGLFAIYENWQDQSALDFHMAQPYLKSFLEEVKEMLREEVHGVICEVIED